VLYRGRIGIQKLSEDTNLLKTSNLAGRKTEGVETNGVVHGVTQPCIDIITYQVVQARHENRNVFVSDNYHDVFG
jgi:hypothetical protein